MLKKAGIAILSTQLLFFTMSCGQKPRSSADTTVQVYKTHKTVETKAPSEKPAGSVQKQASGLPRVMLEKGDRGDNVRVVQTALKKVGYTLVADGIFGDITAQDILDLKSQIKGLQKNAVYDTATAVAIQKVFDGKTKITSGKTVGKVSKPKTIAKQDGNSTPDTVVGDPTSLLVLVNKTHKLPDGYRPQDLVEPNVPFPFKEKLEKRLLRKAATDALEKLFAGVKSVGLQLYAQSGFRSYERQKTIFASNTIRYGSAAKANQVSAYPGESEHQTGLTMDVTSPKINFDLIQAFGSTVEGRWLRDHAHDYGFIIRYPQGKESITGYTYEPWHIRYVGVDAASAIYNQDITLEEYLGQK